MKVGFNMLLWTGHVTEDDFPRLDMLKKVGFDGVEIPLFGGDVAHFEKVGQAIKDSRLGCTSVTIIPDEEHNPNSADANHRKGGLEHIKWAVDSSQTLGSEVLCGPFCQPLDIFTGEAPTEEKKGRDAEVYQKAADYAAKGNVALSTQQSLASSCIGIDVGSASIKMYSFKKSSINTQKGESFVRKSWNEMFEEFVSKEDWVVSMSVCNLEYKTPSIWKDNNQSDYNDVEGYRHSTNAMPMYSFGSSCHSRDHLLGYNAKYCSSDWQKMDRLRAKFCSIEDYCIKTSWNQSKGFSKQVLRSLRKCYSFSGTMCSRDQLKLPSEEYATFERGCREPNYSYIQVQVRESRKTGSRNKIPYDRNLLLAVRRGFSKAA